MVELYPSGLQRSFFDEEDLNSIAEGDNVYAFQAPPPPGQEILSGTIVLAYFYLNILSYRFERVLIVC